MSRAGWVKLVAWTVAACGYIAANTLVATRLTFFWDDWDVLWQQETSPSWGLWDGSPHKAPLSRLVFRLESVIFREQYWGYVLVGAILAFTTIVLVWLSLRDLVRSSILVAVGAMYLTSLGVLIHVDTAVGGFWLLSIALTWLAAYVWLQFERRLVSVMLLLLSGLAMSSLLATNAATVAAVVLVACREAPNRRSNASLDRRLAWASAGGGAALTVAISGVGLLSAPVASVSGVEPGGSLDTVVTAASLFGAWMVAPVSVVGLTTEGFLTTIAVNFSMFFVQILAIVVIAIVAAAIALWQLTARRGGSVRSLTVTQFASTIALLSLPVALMALFVSLTRQNSLFVPRYMAVWLIPAALAWASLTLPSRPRVARLAASALLVATAAVGILRFPSVLLAAADSDRPRLEMSIAQVDLLETCGEGVSAKSLPEVAPQLDGGRLCQIWERLKPP